MSERDVNTVNLFQWRYEELVEKERQLDALEAYGVDNWDGYSEAMGSIKELPQPPHTQWQWQKEAAERGGDPRGDSSAA